MEYKDNKSFMGRGFKFPICVDPATSRIVMCSAEDDISDAIKIIIGTNVGERVMLPEFGTTAGDYIFSDNMLEQITALEDSVADALERWEPRITDISVRASNESGENGMLKISISYTVRATNNQFNMVYPFYIMEGEGK